MGIEVLGPVRLRTDSGVPVGVPERKVRLLLAALVAAGGNAVPADALIERVWGGQLPAHPERVLRAKLSVLRAALDRVRPGMRARLRHGPGGYTLDAGSDMVDAEKFVARVAQARRISSAADRAAALKEALSWWRGPAYADVTDQLWLGPVIESLHDARLTAVERCAEALLEGGSSEAALELVHGEITDHPLRERMVGAQMLALYQVGRQDEALRAYESLRRRLANDVGADPTPNLRELHARVLRHDAALIIPAENQRIAMPGNLAAATTPLIGRAPESDRVAELLETHRLVTVTGVGGVGKTRLALHVAHTVTYRFDRGVWWVDLTQLSRHRPDEGLDPSERVAQHVVSALGLPDDSTTGNGVDQLVRTMGDRSVLIVFDNAEHVVAEAAVFADELLGRASGARLLVTSRQALALPAEQRFDLTPLSTVPGGSLSAASEFFIARARAADPGFDPDEVSITAIEELGRRLDGLPLALELAASRVRGLSVNDLLDRLTDRLNLLARAGYGVPRRQQTLRGMIDWSWSLLHERERAVLRRMAVHPGSWSLSAIETICADDAGTTRIDPGQVVDVLIGLVDRSMVDTVSVPAGGLRYRLLESIELYAAERLAEAGERHAVARRHLDYFRDLVHREDTRLRGPEQRESLPVLEAEGVHIDHAFGEALAADDFGGAIAIAVSLFWYRWITGQHTRLRGDLAAAIRGNAEHDGTFATAVTLEACLGIDEHPGEEIATIRAALELFAVGEPARAKAQWFAGASLLTVGVRAAGEELIDAAISTLQESGETWHVVAAVGQRDWFLVSQWAAPPKGLPDGREHLDAARASGDRYLESQALQIPQRAAENAGEHEHAANLAEQTLQICVESGFISEAAWSAGSAAVGAVRRGDIGHARERIRHARALAAEVGDLFAQTYADFAEAMTARFCGDVSRARMFLEGWRHGAHTFQGDPSAQIEHAYLSIEEEDLTSASQVLRDLAPLVTAFDRPRLVGRCLELDAALRHAHHDDEMAARLLGISDAHRDRNSARRDVVEEADVSRLWKRLDEQEDRARIEAAYRAGLRQLPEHVVTALV